MIQATQTFLCNFLFCLPGSHPWDYGYHFFVNLVGVILMYIVIRKGLGKLRLSRKTALVYSVFFLAALGAAKEIEDNLLRDGADTPIDMFANFLGATLASVVVVTTRIRSVRHL